MNLKNYQCDYENLKRICYTIIILSCILSIYLAYKAQFQAPGIGDESLYWYLISSQKTTTLTWFNKYFTICKNYDIIKLRLMFYFFIMISGSIFGVCFICFQRCFYKISIIDSLIIVLLSAAALYLIRPHESLLPNYSNMNLFVSYLGFSILLLGLCIFEKENNISEKNRSKYGYILILISGIILAQLLFVMPTNGVMLFYIVFALLFFQYKASISFIIGVCGGIIIFFIFIFPFNEWIVLFQKATYYVSKDKTSSHSVSNILRWLFKTIKEMIICTILPGTAIYTLLKPSTHNSKLNGKLICFFCVCSYIILSAIICYFSNVTREGCFDIYIPLTISFGIIYYNFIQKFTRDKISKNIFYLLLSLHVLLVPIFLSFGTDVVFSIRGQEYILFPLIFSLCYSIINKNKYILISLTLLIIIGTLLGYKQINAGNSQTREKLSNCTIELQDFNCKAKVSQRRLNQYREMEKLLNGIHYICGGPYIWHFVQVLKKDPLYINFKCYFKELPINVSPNDLAIILEENSDYTDEEYKLLIDELKVKSYKKHKIDYYYVITFNE